jgi:hypothetical protein
VTVADDWRVTITLAAEQKSDDLLADLTRRQTTEGAGGSSSPGGSGHTLFAYADNELAANDVLDAIRAVATEHGSVIEGTRIDCWNSDFREWLTAEEMAASAGRDPEDREPRRGFLDEFFDNI